MKKYLSLALALLIAASLAACGSASSAAPQASSGGAAPSPGSQAAAPVKKTNYAIGSSGSTGAQYIISAAIASEVNKYAETINIDVQATTGASESVALMASGDNGFAIGAGGTLWSYRYGTGYCTPEEQVENLSGVVSLNYTAGQLIARKDAGISSWADLKGKRVCMGTNSVATYSMSQAVMKTYGVNWETDIEGVLLTQTEMCEKLADGDLDAIYMNAAPPTAAIMNLFAEPDKYVLISGDEANLQQVIDNDFPFLQLYTIEAGTYSDQDYDALVLADTNQVICRTELPDEHVYEYAKLLWDNWEVIKQGHGGLPAVDPSTFCDTAVPLHPGAEKFYKEIGILQ